MVVEWKKISWQVITGNIPPFTSEAQPILPSLNITKEGKYSNDGPHTIWAAR